MWGELLIDLNPSIDQVLLRSKYKLKDITLSDSELITKALEIWGLSKQDCDWINAKAKAK